MATIRANYFANTPQRVMTASDDFYALPPITDYRLEGDQLTWTSAVKTPSAENNIAHGRFFPAKTKNGKKIAECRRRVAAMERATGKSRRSVPDLQHDRHVGAASDASLSSATQPAGTRTRRSSRQHKHRTHHSIDEAGCAGYACSGAVVESGGL